MHQGLLVVLLSLFGKNLTALVVAALATAIVAPALYHFVEEPMRGLLSGEKSLRRRSVPAANVA